MYQSNNTELSSPEETRLEFNPGKAAIKLGIDVHQEFYVVAMQVGGTQPKPAQRFRKEAFLRWAAKLARTHRGPLHAVYEACGFGFGLQRQLSALGIECYVVCPQKLDEHNKAGEDRLARCQGALFEVGPLYARQPRCAGVGTGAERGGRTTPRRAPPT